MRNEPSRAPWLQSNLDTDGEPGNRDPAVRNRRSDGDRGEDGFRIRSYRNGATAIEGYPERIADILANPERKVTEIPGIGKGMAAVLDEIVERGSCRAARSDAGEVSGRRARIAQDPGTRAQEHRGPVRAFPRQHHRRAGAALHASRNCVTCRAWARSSRRRSCGRSRSTGSSAGRYLLSFAEQDRGGADRVSLPTLPAWTRSPGRQPAPRQGDGRRSRSAGHRARLPRRRSTRFVAHPQSARGARAAARTRPARKCRPRRAAGGCARAAAGELRRCDAILHRQQGAQRRAATARAQAWG